MTTGKPGGAPVPPTPSNASPKPSSGVPSNVPAGAGPGVRPVISRAGPRLSLLPAPFLVLDVETRRSAPEVGGWHRAGDMGVSVAVLYDSREDSFRTYRQEEIPELAARLAEGPLVVGFNILSFDYAVLAPHAGGLALPRRRTLDMLREIEKSLGRRLSLDALAGATLGAEKSADGMAALRWWKDGRLDLIESYCRDDVRLTRDLYLHGREHGFVLGPGSGGATFRIAVNWE